MKAVEGLSDIKKLQLEFWQAFNQYAFEEKDFGKYFSKRKPQAQHWYDMSVGSSAYHLGLTTNTQKNLLGVEIYINDDKELFEHFKTRKVEIENDAGTPLEWKEASKACRILAVKNGNIKDDESAWNQYFDWYCEMTIKFKEIIKKYNN